MTKADLQRIKANITNSCRDDFKAWVTEAVEEMEKADAVGDTRKIFNLANMLSNQPKKPPVNLTTDSASNLLRSPEDTAKTWEDFLAKTFEATPEEHLRPALQPIPKIDDPITRKEFDAAVKNLKCGKAMGPDAVSYTHLTLPTKA